MEDNSSMEIWLAGAGAAVTVDLLVYPLDTIKTRWQSQDFAKTYSSTVGVRKIHTNVFKGLYQGVGSVVLVTLPAAGTFFTTYESAKSIYTNLLPSGAPQPAVHAAASATAELVSCLVLTPAEVVKQNAQMLRQSGGRSTSLEAWRMLRQSEGGAARRLWRGYTVLAARNMPHTAVQFPIFEYIRGCLWVWMDRRRVGSRVNASPSPGRRKARGVQESTPAAGAEPSTVSSVVRDTFLVNGASAGLSGALAAIVTTPTDVVKTRMMLGGASQRANKQSAHRTGTGQGSWEVAQQVFQERGVKGFFRGGALRAVWTALASGLYLGTYEVSKVCLKERQSQSAR